MSTKIYYGLRFPMGLNIYTIREEIDNEKRKDPSSSQMSE
jgi:hypothetical protein